jgi:exonuclease SbcC
LLERLKRETETKQKMAKEGQEVLAEKLKVIETSLAAAKAEGKKLQAELSAIRSEIAVEESAKKNAETRAKRKKELEEKMAALSGGKGEEALRKERDELKSEVDRLVEEHSWLHAQRESLMQAIGTLSLGAAKCPVCDSDLSDGKSQKIAGEKQSQLENGVKLAGKLAEELAGKKLALSAFEARMNELKIFTKEMERLSAEGIDIAGMQKALDEKGAKRKVLEAGIETNETDAKKSEKGRESAKTALEEAVRTAKLFSELEIASAKLFSSEKKLSEMKFDEKDYDAARKQLEEQKVSFAKTDAELRGEEKQQKLILEMLSLEQAALAALQEKETRAKKYAEAAGSMQIYKNSLALAQSELRGELVSEINQALVEIWPAVYPYADYGGIKLEADEKDYRLLMQKQGWREVDAVASGGERACLCLALRIAFATVLTPDIGWLILDEPTHNLDADAVLMLSEAINNKIPSIVEQTFVITHDIALGENGEGNVFRLERDKSKNEPTRVEPAS